jgi:hypothetical protein
MLKGKQKLVEYLGKEELTWSDLEHMLPLFGTMIGEISDMNFFRKNGVAEIQESLESMLFQLNGLGKSLIQISDNLDKEINLWWDRGEEQYAEFSEKHKRLKNKFESMPEINLPNIQIPYSFEKAIEVAEKLDSMTPETKKLLLELYKIGGK